jgi:hypothetical protein
VRYGVAVSSAPCQNAALVITDIRHLVR